MCVVCVCIYNTHTSPYSQNGQQMQEEWAVENIGNQLRGFTVCNKYVFDVQRFAFTELFHKVSQNVLTVIMKKALQICSL